MRTFELTVLSGQTVSNALTQNDLDSLTQIVVYPVSGTSTGIQVSGVDGAVAVASDWTGIVLWDEDVNSFDILGNINGAFVLPFAAVAGLRVVVPSSTGQDRTAHVVGI